MSDAPDFELVIRILRGLQAGQAETRQAIANLAESVGGVRNQLHVLHGDSLRQEHLIAGLRVDVDRIKARLEIADHNA